MNPRRVLTIKPAADSPGPVMYWMGRDQRANDNWALLYAQAMAVERNVPLAIVFCLVPDFLQATIRQYTFMIHGLQEVEKALAVKSIPFFLAVGEPREAMIRLVKKIRPGTLVIDFDPLRIRRRWQKEVVDSLKIPVFQVDAHNVVPCWLASPKQEFGAYTLRPKIHKLLGEFLDEFPPLKKHPVTWPEKVPAVDWDAAGTTLQVDRTMDPVAWLSPGEKAAGKMLEDFVTYKLRTYDADRNDPTKDGQSNLSPYIHFGQISAQRVALTVTAAKVPVVAKEAFLDELIVRKELSDNFCFYNPNYDNFNGFPRWAQETLNAHRRDPRPNCFDFEAFEQGKTYDPLWNAAQNQMVRTGKMHGYLRMYWGKKILEWTQDPEAALRIAIELNDKYELDGRDPNGYVGIAWSIGGLHDRPWRQRPIYGKIRYMSYNGCKSKFDVDAYIRRYAGEQ